MEKQYLDLSNKYIISKLVFSQLTSTNKHGEKSGKKQPIFPRFLALP